MFNWSQPRFAVECRYMYMQAVLAVDWRQNEIRFFVPLNLAYFSHVHIKSQRDLGAIRTKYLNPGELLSKVVMFGLCFCYLCPIKYTKLLNIAVL